MDSIDTVIAFGDAFSAQFGTLTNQETGELSINQLTWTDFSSGLQGNPIFDDGRMNYLNYLTGCTQDGIDPLACSPRLIDLATASEDESIETGITKQIILWREYVLHQLQFHSNRTLASLFLGKELVAKLQHLNMTQTATASVSSYIQEIQDGMQQLYEDGVTQFLVFTLPADEPDIENIVQYWNTELTQSAITFQARTPEATLYLMDTFEYYNNILADASTYGYKDVTEPCISTGKTRDCSITSQYIRLDSSRWTPRAHLDLADAVKDMLAQQAMALQGRPVASAAVTAGTKSPGKTTPSVTEMLKTSFQESHVLVIVLLTCLSAIGLVLVVWGVKVMKSRRISLNNLKFWSSRGRSTVQYSQVTARAEEHELQTL